MSEVNGTILGLLPAPDFLISRNVEYSAPDARTLVLKLIINMYFLLTDS